MADNKRFVTFCPKCQRRFANVEPLKVLTCPHCMSDLLPVRIDRDTYFLRKIETIEKKIYKIPNRKNKIEGPHISPNNFPNNQDFNVKENDQKLLDNMLESGNYKKVLEYIDDIRNDKNSGCDAPILYYYEMLARAKQTDYKSFVNENGFEKEDLALIKKALKVSSNKTGEKLLAKLYSAALYHPTCYDFFKLTLPYLKNHKISEKTHSAAFNNAFVSAISMRDKKTFNLLVSALDEDDVRSYYHWLLLLENKLDFADIDLALAAIEGHAHDSDTLVEIAISLIKKKADIKLLNRCIDLLLSNGKVNLVPVIENVVTLPNNNKDKTLLLARLLPYVNDYEKGQSLVDIYKEIMICADKAMDDKLYQEALIMYCACVAYIKDNKQLASLFLKISKADTALRTNGKKTDGKNSLYYEFYDYYNDKTRDSDDNKQEVTTSNDIGDIKKDTPAGKEIYTTKFRFKDLHPKAFKAIIISVIVVAATAVTVTAGLGIAEKIIEDNIAKQNEAKFGISNFSLSLKDKEKIGDDKPDLKLTFGFTNNSQYDVSWGVGTVDLAVTTTLVKIKCSSTVILRRTNENEIFNKDISCEAIFTIPFPKNASTEEQKLFKKLVDADFTTQYSANFTYRYLKFTTEDVPYYYGYNSVKIK